MFIKMQYNYYVGVTQFNLTQTQIGKIKKKKNWKLSINIVD